MRNIVFFDVDGTIIKGQSQQLLIKYLFKKKKVNIIFLLRLYLWFFLYKLHLVKNPKAIMEYSYNLLKGWNHEQLAILLEDFYNDVIKERINSWVKDRISYFVNKNYQIVIISNIFYPLAKLIADKLHINTAIATRLKTINDVYTGEIEGNIVYGEEKKRLAEKYVSENNFTLNDSYSFADHISDLSILILSENPVAVCPDKYLFKIAMENKWEIIK